MCIMQKQSPANYHVYPIEWDNKAIYTRQE